MAQQARTHQVQRGTVQSSMANLESRTSEGAVREAKPQGINNGQAVNFSGQYLYDTFVENKDDRSSIVQGETTKMGIVRQMVKQMDTANFKKALSDMLKIAKERYPTAKGEPVHPRVKTAQNHQGVMKIAYGALKNAADLLNDVGITDKTGYQDMRVLGKAALDKKGIKWDGTKAEPAEQREERLRQKDEMKVMQELQKANPINKGESIADYTTRIMGMYEEALEEHREEQQEAKINELATKMLKEYPEIAGLVAERMLELIENPPEEEQLEKTPEQLAAEQQQPEVVH